MRERVKSVQVCEVDFEGRDKRMCDSKGGEAGRRSSLRCREHGEKMEEERRGASFYGALVLCNWKVEDEVYGT